ncbi:hypothetical protein Tco_1092636 [Tanacetum coccineum]|uniref:Uncharacterized protein n=1 Tax=Tanacetum coccineum TaxID=301880 RepID=A0ABQ5ICM3_9ASTR
MYGFKECSSCGALYNRERCCSNVSSVNNFVHDPNQISYDETPDSHQQPPRNCSNCGVENHSLNLNPNSFIDSPNIFNPPPQPQTYSCELCGNDAHYVSVIHQPPQEMSIQDIEDLKQQYLDEMKSLINEIQIKDYNDEKIDIEIKIKIQQLEQVANPSTYPSRHFNSFCYNDDDDDDGEFSIPVSEIYKSSLTAITPNSPITDSLIMEDKHLDTILETKSDEENESSVEDLNLIASESEDLSDIEISSAKFDSLLEEFSGELAHIDLISPEIDEANFDPEEEIYLVEKLLYDNCSPRPPKEFNSENSDAVIKSFSPSPIPLGQVMTFLEEIDIFHAPDGLDTNGVLRMTGL